VPTTAHKRTQHSPRYFPAATAGTWNSYLNESKTSSVHVTSAITDDVQSCNKNTSDCSNDSHHVEHLSSETQLDAITLQSAQEKVIHRVHLYSLRCTTILTACMLHARQIHTQV
jgi:hypothetical protein